jgi:hypothetical protein
MPTWFPWIFIGGVVFALLSFVAAKYQDRPHTGKSLAQDFISGGIVVALLGVIAPDAFPASPLPTEIPSVFTGGGGSSDIDLQVGPPPLARR